MAIGKGGSFIEVNGSSKEHAESRALAGCRKRNVTPQSCTIEPEFTRTERLYYVSAESATGIGVGRALSADEARAHAMASCRQHGSASACKASKAVLNETGKPEPRAMGRLYELVARKAPAAAERTVATTRSTNVLSCTNQCANGMCIRTFPDGRKERWTAPRRYDPSTGNWGWDTSTNPCGT